MSTACMSYRDISKMISEKTGINYDTYIIGSVMNGRGLDRFKPSMVENVRESLKAVGIQPKSPPACRHNNEVPRCNASCAEL
jgi:hypothetical protein